MDPAPVDFGSNTGSQEVAPPEVERRKVNRKRKRSAEQKTKNSTDGSDAVKVGASERGSNPAPRGAGGSKPPTHLGAAKRRVTFATRPPRVRI